MKEMKKNPQSMSNPFKKKYRERGREIIIKHQLVIEAEQKNEQEEDE